MALETVFTNLRIRALRSHRSCQKTLASLCVSRQNQSRPFSLYDRTHSSQPQSSGQPAQSSADGSKHPFSDAAPPSPGSPAEKVARQTGFDVASQAVRTAAAGGARKKNEENQLTKLQKLSNQRDLDKQAARRWRIGDVYAPHDLSGVEQSKWKRVRRRSRGKHDVMDQLGINPLDHYKNFSIMSEYMTEMGRIKHSSETGLRPINQRRMAKAIRRAIGCGLMPGAHRHPELLKREGVLRQ